MKNIDLKIAFVLSTAFWFWILYIVYVNAPEILLVIVAFMLIYLQVKLYNQKKN